MIVTIPQSAIARSKDGTAIGFETLGAGDGLLVVGGAWRAGQAG